MWFIFDGALVLFDHISLVLLRILLLNLHAGSYIFFWVCFWNSSCYRVFLIYIDFTVNMGCLFHHTRWELFTAEHICLPAILLRLYVLFCPETNCHPLLNILDIWVHFCFSLWNYGRFLAAESWRIRIAVSRSCVLKLLSLQTDLTSIIRHLDCFHLGKFFVNFVAIKVMYFNMLTFDIISWLIERHRLWTLNRTSKQVFILGGHMWEILRYDIADQANNLRCFV